jgi:hypothetical protein
MTPDNIIHMHFKKEATKTDNFEQELYQALVHADCCIKPNDNFLDEFFV